jgi:hypothetical protein
MEDAPEPLIVPLSVDSGAVSSFDAAAQPLKN